VAWWLASVFVFCAAVATFDTLVYGGPLRSGYRPAEITFSLSAISANLRSMPTHLIQAMPMLVLGLAALAGIVLQWLPVSTAWRTRPGSDLQHRRVGGRQRGQDLAVVVISSHRTHVRMLVALCRGVRRGKLDRHRLDDRLQCCSSSPSSLSSSPCRRACWPCSNCAIGGSVRRRA
jgi:hypothetical protein